MLQMTGSDRKLKDGPVFDQGFSSREARRRAFIALGPGWAGFSVKPDPEEDGDQAVQLRADANVAQVLEGDLRVSRFHSRELSIEAMELLGIEIADPMSLPSSDEDGEAETKAFVRDQFAAEGMEYREDNPEGDEDGDGWPDEDEHPRATIFRDGQFLAARQEWNPMGAPGRYMRRCRREVMRIFALNLTADFARHAERRARSVEGTVVRHAEYGIFVQSGRDIGLVPVNTVRGHGSRARALAFLHGNAVGSKVRVIPGAFRAAKRRYDLELL